MAFYNAIILNEKKKIVGRTHVADLLRFSTTMTAWIVQHRGVTVKSEAHLKETLSGPNNLLVISKPGEDEIEINVKPIVGKTMSFTMTRESTVLDLKMMVEAYRGTSTDHCTIICSGKQLDNHGLLVKDYNLSHESTVHLQLRLKGRDVSKKIMEDGDQLDPRDEDQWMGYEEGFNIIGKCENSKCRSRKSGYRPIANRRFGECRVTGDLLFCPACNKKTLKPTNFLVAGARSALNFRKTGEMDVKFTLLESSGPFPRYVKLTEKNNEMEYDEIMVYTVDLYSSPFHCCACNSVIKNRSSEVMTGCGHYFHSDCLGGWNDCPVCESKLLDSETVAKLFMH